MTVTVVIKVGGSLFSEPGAMERVADWLSATKRPSESRLLLAGGGAPVEALRAIDAANPLAPLASHDAAIQIMDAGARLLADWLPGAKTTESLDEIAAHEEPADWILACRRWIETVEPDLPGERLNAGWETTSDSIAARIASVCETRLILLKHTFTTTYDSLDAAAEADIVDREFVRHARGVPVELVGLVRPGWHSEARIGG